VVDNDILMDDLLIHDTAEESLREHGEKRVRKRQDRCTLASIGSPSRERKEKGFRSLEGGQRSAVVCAVVLCSASL
jgi:hypothetical protein